MTSSRVKPRFCSARLGEYGRLFDTALIGRDRDDHAIKFRFRAGDGIEARVRDLAARAQACCSFFTFSITSVPGEVVWEASVVDDDVARAILGEFYALPDTISGSVEAAHERFSAPGPDVVITEDGVQRLAAPEEIFRGRT
jgi:hypothetical protein